MKIISLIIEKTVKPFLSEKNKSREKITLLKNEEIISDEVKVANTLNTFFLNTVKNLKLQKNLLIIITLIAYQDTQL